MVASKLFALCLVVSCAIDPSGLFALAQRRRESKQKMNEPIEFVDDNPKKDLKECEGDCDKDSDCKGDLVCFHRNKNTKREVPGCEGGDKDGSRTDYCIKKSSFVEFEQQALGLCETGCKEDFDCRGNLVCYHHLNENQPLVSGCGDEGDQDSDQEEGATSYCVEKSDKEELERVYLEASLLKAEAVSLANSPASHLSVVLWSTATLYVLSQ